MRGITLFLILVLSLGLVFVPSQQQVTYTSFAEQVTNEGLDVLFCSYFGGEGEEWSNDVCFTADGGFVLSGMTMSDDLPVMNAHQSQYGGAGDAYLVKVGPQFNVEFYTYFGGTGSEEPMALVVDSEDNIILAGGTSSDDLTLLNPLQDELNGSSDAFVAKYSSSGTLLFSSYLGGSDFERIEDVVIDSSGNYLLVGPTGSDDFYTTPGVCQETYGGGDSDVFITSLANDGQSILFSSFFGNATDDDAWGIGTDQTGNIVVIGMTDGDEMATDSSFQEVYGGGLTDAFVAKFSSDCSSIMWATLLGGNGWEFGDQVEFDSSDNIVVSGYTGSSDFPLENQLYNDTGGYDAFFSKLNPDGDTLLLSSYLGGSFEDRSYAMDVLDDDSILIACPTSSADMPVENAFSNHSGASDGYLGLIDGDTPELLFGSHYGGSSNDYVLGMSVYSDEMVAVIGYTSSDDLPTINAVQDEYGGSSDTMVWVFGFEEPPMPANIPILAIAVVTVGIIAVVIVVVMRRRP